MKKTVVFPRKDPFSEDLLPFDVPPLFDSLPEDDKMGISEQIG